MNNTIEQIPASAKLIQDSETVKYFNDLYGQDFSYWFVLEVDGDIEMLWGSYSCLKNKPAFQIEVRSC